MQLAPKTTGVPTPPSPEVITLDVGGMKCAGCAAAVERQLIQQTGVISARVNLATEVATIECEVGIADPAALAKKLTDTGFPSQLRCAENQQDIQNAAIARRRREIQQQIRQLAIALILILLSGIGHLVSRQTTIGNIWFHWGLATLALLLPGRAILLDGCRGLWRKSPNMNTLVGLGAFTAYTASTLALFFPQLGWECFFDEPVMLLGFILLGKTLEQQAKHRAAAAIQALMALQPATARLVVEPLEIADNPTEALKNPKSIEIPADRVRVGEWLQVLPGEKIPVDGEIYSGTTTIDESMLTGESIPVYKQRGDGVAAGTLNQSGAIVLRATRTGKETTLAQIVSLVETAQTRKAPIQFLADRVAGYFTYGVMTIAVLTFLFWYWVGTRVWPEVLWQHEAWGHWHEATSMTHAIVQSPLLLSLKLAIAVLVIACPCALGLATPTAILVGSGLGAERGLLIRGGDVLEKVHQLDAVVFDKTGTLTTGHPTVTDCFSLSPTCDPHQILQIAATVEQGACHPVAEAILQEATRQGIALLDAENFQTEAGLGVSAVIAGESILVGNAAWLQQHGIATMLPSLPSLQGKTLVYVAQSGKLQGAIGVSDVLRSDAKPTVDRLKQMGLQVLLLTGDRGEVAAAIAQSLQLSTDEVLADVRPAQKAEAIAQLQARGYRVAMVGDGINDAPALVQADIGIALHGGTDAAVETAQIVLMRDTLMDVVAAINLSRATFNKIRQNLFWAFAYNLLGIPVAAGILLPFWGIVLSPAAAGAFMAFSSVSVVTNSLLLRRARVVQQSAAIIDSSERDRISIPFVQGE